MGEIGEDGIAIAIEFTKSVTTLATTGSVKGANVVETHITEDGTYFVLVELKKEDVANNVVSAVRSRQDLYNELKSRMSSDDFEKNLRSKF